MNYYDFLGQKNKFDLSKGLDISKEEISTKLFDWQKECVEWALKKGKCALFEACGLGKTFQQLEWARLVHKITGGNVLIVAPLGVAYQTADEEATKLNINVNLIRSTQDIKDGISITNYEILEQIDTSSFIGVVLDESSILKNFAGKIRTKITDKFKNTPYKLCCTATPAPNDYMELLNHAEFLGIMTTAQALSIYFINDMKTGSWRLKGHATTEFWKWVCSWALNIEKPSDIGYENKGYDLPQLNEYEEIVEVDILSDDFADGLFRDIKMSATSFYNEKRRTIEARVKRVLEIINRNPNEQYLIWVDMNEEANALKKLLPNIIEVRGSDKVQYKEDMSKKFKNNEIQILVSKPKIFGYGMNFQNCHNVIFCGLTYSYENYYQALRRIYRFGQTKEVNSYIVLGNTEKTILENIRRKEMQQREMKNSMALSIKDLQQVEVKGISRNTVIKKETVMLPNWL